MTDITAQQLMRAQAQPLTVTVSFDDFHWHVRVWVDLDHNNLGTNVGLIHEVELDCVYYPYNARHVDLWTEVAITLEDFAHGVGLKDSGE